MARQDDLVTSDEAAEYLGTSTYLLDALRHQGLGPQAIEAGEEWLYRRDDLDRLRVTDTSASPSNRGHALLTPDEAASRLRTSIPSLARWRGLGTGPVYVKRGGRIFYAADDVDAFIEQSKRDKTRPRAPEPYVRRTNRRR